MSESERVAYVISQSVVLFGELMGMHAENQCRADQGKTPAYDEASFRIAVDRSPVHHNAVIEILRRPT